MGRDLIKSAEIRAQISQIEEFRIAVNSFKAKYGYLPGDMPPRNAGKLGFFQFTGTYSGSTCGGVFAYGNNDGIINVWTEAYPFWRHLSDAGMIKGKYGDVTSNPLVASTSSCSGGNTGAGNATTTPTGYDQWIKFLPPAKINNSLVYTWGNYWFAPLTSQFFFSDTNKANFFLGFGASANQAYQMDSKSDDGFPSSGNIRELRVFYNGSPSNGVATDYPPCTTSGASPMKYNFATSTVDTVSCSPTFLF